MELKLSDCSKEKFLEYAKERKLKGMSNNRYMYSYLTETRLAKVFDYLVKRNLKCSGRNYRVTEMNEFCSSFSQPEQENIEQMEECLFHEVWCKCEWIYRIIDKEREFYESLKGYIGAKTVKEMESVA